MPSVVRLPVRLRRSRAGQVFLEAFGSYRRAQQLALALQQSLIGLQVEQALVVAVVIVAGAGGEFEQHLPAAFLMAGQHIALFDDLFQAQLEGMLTVLQQRQHLLHHLVLEQAFLLREDTLAEQLFQPCQLAAFEQRLVTANLRHQRLFGRQRQDVGAINAQLLRGGVTDILDCLLHEGFASDIVPEHVDLVQDGEQAVLRVFVELADVLLPDLHVAGGGAGVGGKQEHDRLGIGQHRQGQFRLAAQRVQAGCIENAQALA